MKYQIVISHIQPDGIHHVVFPEEFDNLHAAIEGLQVLEGEVFPYEHLTVRPVDADGSEPYRPYLPDVRPVYLYAILAAKAVGEESHIFIVPARSGTEAQRIFRCTAAGAEHAMIYKKTILRDDDGTPILPNLKKEAENNESEKEI